VGSKVTELTSGNCTSNCWCADGPAKMILPLERTIAVDEAKALRKAITRMVSAETVGRMHVPLVGVKFTEMLLRCCSLSNPPRVGASVAACSLSFCIVLSCLGI
jgi:hypothetical protein